MGLRRQIIKTRSVNQPWFWEWHYFLVLGSTAVSSIALCIAVTSSNRAAEASRAALDLQAATFLPTILLDCENLHPRILDFTPEGLEQVTFGVQLLNVSDRLALEVVIPKPIVAPLRDPLPIGDALMQSDSVLSRAIAPKTDLYREGIKAQWYPDDWERFLNGEVMYFHMFVRFDDIVGRTHISYTVVSLKRLPGDYLRKICEYQRILSVVR